MFYFYKSKKKYIPSEKPKLPVQFANIMLRISKMFVKKFFLYPVEIGYKNQLIGFAAGRANYHRGTSSRERELKIHQPKIPHSTTAL
jgi:hypothetical protein